VKKNHKQSLEDKAWYRLFKVVFFIAFLLTLPLGFFFYYVNTPSKSFDPLIACDDERIFVASKTGLYISEYYVSSYDKGKMREICNGGYRLVSGYKEEGSLKNSNFIRNSRHFSWGAISDSNKENTSLYSDWR
jgi:hypothetical protein